MNWKKIHLSWRAIILFAVLFTSSIFLWQSLKQPTPDQVFEKHFKAYVIKTTPRGLTNELDEYMLGSVYYSDGKYSHAIKQFSKVLAQNPSDYRAQLLSGISHLALKEFSYAERFLLALVNDNSHLFQDQAHWYLGLTYLSDNDIENDKLALIYLNQISDPQLKEKAEELFFK